MVFYNIFKVETTDNILLVFDKTFMSRKIFSIFNFNNILAFLISFYDILRKELIYTNVIFKINLIIEYYKYLEECE